MKLLKSNEGGKCVHKAIVKIFLIIISSIIMLIIFPENVNANRW